MAGGSPHDLFNVFGLKVPKWKVSAYMMAGYVGIYALVKLKNAGKPEPEITLDNDQKSFVEKYIKEHHEKQHLPKYLRGEKEVFVARH